MIVPLHGLGGARDLPIPLEFAIGGALAALVLSFVVLAAAWRRPRYDAATGGRPLPEGLARVIDSPVTRWAIRLLALAFFGVLGLALFLGVDNLTNPVFVAFYVLVWVGIVPASLIAGPAWRLVSPVRTLHLLLSKATGGDPAVGMRAYPASWGYWPAALGLLAFVWQELVNPDQVLLSSVRLWISAYVAILLIGAAVYGDRFLERGDPFEVYSTLVGRLSPLGRREDGTLVVRSPFTGLDGLRPEPGLVAVLAVLFGSTAYDSFRESPMWLGFLADKQGLENPIGSAALLGSVLLVGATFTLAARATCGALVPRRELPGLLVPSIVPIVVGYMTAHYLTYFVVQSQQLIQQISDPLSTGADYLGTADRPVDYWLNTQPTLLASVKVLVIVTGHIVGAVAAHDRALKILGPAHRLTGQLAMLAIMVTYTGTGLWLLFSA